MSKYMSPHGKNAITTKTLQLLTIWDKSWDKMSLSNLDLSIKLDPGFWTKTSWIQLMYGVWVNFAQLGIGLAFGFPAVQVPQLSSPDSDITITREEASWIGWYCFAVTWANHITEISSFIIIALCVVTKNFLTKKYYQAFYSAWSESTANPQ